MTWLSYLFPRTILVTSSKYNSQIRVNEEQGKYKLLVNGSRQSGEYIRGLWKHALDLFGVNRNLNISSILVLGVAGGTVIHELHVTYPKAQITGVEIDRVMLEIGKKYFQLAAIPQLTLIKADAKGFVKAAVNQKLHYDLIIIDLFIGRQIPEFVLQRNFLGQIKTLLSPQGRVLINYLRELEYRQQSESFLKILRNVFSKVRDTGIERNRFFCCRK